jgi:hypothetical protein
MQGIVFVKLPNFIPFFVSELSTWNEAVDDLSKWEQRHRTCVNPAAEYDQRSLTFGPSFPHRIRNTPANKFSGFICLFGQVHKFCVLYL